MCRCKSATLRWASSITTMTAIIVLCIAVWIDKIRTVETNEKWNEFTDAEKNLETQFAPDYVSANDTNIIRRQGFMSETYNDDDQQHYFTDSKFKMKGYVWIGGCCACVFMSIISLIGTCTAKNECLRVYFVFPWISAAILAYACFCMLRVTANPGWTIEIGISLIMALIDVCIFAFAGILLCF